MRLGHRLFTAVLFVVIVALQLRFTAMTVGILSDTYSLPESFGVQSRDLKVVDLNKDELAAGMKPGDVLLAEDGVRIHSAGEHLRLFTRHRPGERVTVQLSRRGGAPFTATFTVARALNPGGYWWIVPITLNIVTPWSCILLGFLVAFRRPGDPVALSLLFFLVCVSQMVHAYNQAASWEPWFAWFAMFLAAISNRGMMVAWLWFAIQFPDPESPHRVWPQGRWFLGLPLLAIGLAQATWYPTLMQQPHAPAWLGALADVPSGIVAVLSFLVMGLGFWNFTVKLRTEQNPSLRRRLRWVVAGLGCGIVPILALFAGAEMLYNGSLDAFPLPILLPCVFSPFLIPLTLAYAVLVNRLFDIGMFVRQGLLASKTISAVRVVLLATLVYLTISIPSQKGVSRPIRVAELVACVGGIVVTRRAAKRLGQWVDGRFFQEAVNTEHLLIELSGEVRRLRDAETLLRTVTDRIAGAMHVTRVAALMPELSGFVPAYAFGGMGGVGLAFDDPAVAQLKKSRQPMLRTDDLLVPISAGEDLQGILSLGPKRSEEPYSGRDLALLESVAGQTALALENTRLTATVAEEAAQRERITSELEIARTVQERLFPKSAPKVPGLDLAGRCQPAQTVGGDYYDFFTTPSGAVGFAIGDIAGKGVPAALLMASLQASLRGLTLAGISDLADLMEKLNVLMYDASPANRFATFFCCLYDVETRTLRYSSAGHNPALLWRAGAAEPLWLKTPGTALGLRRKAAYRQAEVILEPGDRLVLYTDGVTEARSLAGEEFEESRLAEAVRAPACSAQELLDAVIAATNAFAAGATQHDDITVIAAVSR
jgi:sigma-B regulation protein RsbU (phosphoserine phosphatase)